MTRTLTTERQQFESWFTKKYPRSHWGTKKTASGEYQGGLTAQLWEVWRESRGCMANREAQPVLYASEETLAYAKEGEKSLVTWSEPMGDAVIPLYAATPAPANAQPVVWEMRYWNSGHNMWHDWERITAEQHAEMSVQHAADNDYEFRVLYDVSPAPAVPDGWIACSERMPDADGAYWCWFGKEKPSVIQQRVCIWNDRNHEWCDSSVTHWMPLPAAPEGGNDE